MSSAFTTVATVRVNKLAANLVGLLVTLLLCVLFVWFAQTLPHHERVAAWTAVPVLVCLLLLLPVHEALHAVGLALFARVAWSNIKFGFLWRALMPYCHCTVPIPVAAYRWMALLPLCVTGGVGVVAVLVYPTDGLALLAGVVVSACIGDVWMVLKLRGFADDLLVQDSPTEIGCDVLVRGEQPAPATQAGRAGGNRD